MVMVFGEITTKSTIDYQKIIRETVKRIGFTDSAIGTPSCSSFPQIATPFFLQFVKISSPPD